MKSEKMRGSVLVIGGGIAGIQASLDLSEMGFYVYLVEKNPAIGGRMAQLDKVFPTNDCSMCIISPKLNETGGHINISVLNNTEILELTGEEGNFTARLLQRPRYLSSDKCTACGDCANVCPVDLQNEFNQNLNTRKVVSKSYAQAYPNSYSLTKKSVSPCVVACPANVNAHGYVSLFGKGYIQEALETILDVLPLPATLGRICAHPCEQSCRRGLLDSPLDLKNIKRAIADKGSLDDALLNINKAEVFTDKVAIIGAGPCGLSCGYHLRRMGVRSTIFEKEGEAGGALRLGIPDYRLPPEILSQEFSSILVFSDATVVYNKALGVDFTIDSLFQDGFMAVFLAMGAHNNIALNISGKDLKGVISGIEFLKNTNSLIRPDLSGKKVLVLGAGNVAMDSARTAIRLKADVTLAYRRGMAAMPAWPWEVREAMEEGLRFQLFRSPLEFLRKGEKIEVTLIKTIVSEKDGRTAKLSYQRNDVTRELYDLVITALGQSPSSEGLLGHKLINISKDGRVLFDPMTFETSMKGVFAGGDLALGPALAIDAVASGKEAAISIARFLKGEDLKDFREKIKFTSKDDYRKLPTKKEDRKKPFLVEPNIRALDFREFDLGLIEDEAIDEARRCASCGACCECFRCVKACLPGALTKDTHRQKGELLDIQVGAVLIASGFEPYDPLNDETYRYKESKNIVTSLEFERILSASGPFQGHMLRPSDHKEPKKIAWVQCVGSRDKNRSGNDYCSSVCCMYAMKEAVVAKEHAQGELDATIFYMDIRAHGKDFEKYYNRTLESKVNFVRSKAHTLTPLPNGDIALKYISDDGESKVEIFDMVVLSVGIVASKDIKPDVLGIELDEHGFVKTLPFESVRTTRKGVYVTGVASEPKDIPTVVAESSAAAHEASVPISKKRFTLTKTREYPLERDIAGEIPRIGVFVCHCGINIASVIDVEEVSRYALSLPFVEMSITSLFTCSADTQEKIREAITQNNLNRVVVASCSPRTHEGMFRETLAQAGLNKFLFEMANIRDQDSWVHQNNPEKATHKAKDLVRAAVAKAAFLEPMQLTKMELTREALVVGGGAAGLSAALGVAKQGFKTHLLERTNVLGGNALEVLSLDKDIEGYVRTLINEATSHPNIQIYLNSTPKSSEGYLGNFETKIDSPEGEKIIKHGVTILAPGGKAHIPSSYHYGEHKNILMSLDFDRLLKAKDGRLEREAAVFSFIMCVESRTLERPYCSRVCCTHTLESALLILERNPSARVFILFRDMRAYGFRERKYEEAREKGVIFIRYESETPPIVELHDGNIVLTAMDHVLKRPLKIHTDFLTLASGIDPNPMKEEIVEVFKGQLNAEGFLLEAHMKLRPVDLATEGQYMAGLAHYPKPIEESILQAKAAAARATAVLSKPYVLAGGVVAVVDPSKCAVCCTCVRSCPFGVPKIVENSTDPHMRGNAFMESAICQGCGVCVSECPGKAIKLQFFTDEQLLAKVSALADRDLDKKTQIS
jgi:heterodisulfide reductase subunit A-like polyferredoxin